MNNTLQPLNSSLGKIDTGNGDDVIPYTSGTTDLTQPETVVSNYDSSQSMSPPTNNTISPSRQQPGMSSLDRFRRCGDDNDETEVAVREGGDGQHVVVKGEGAGRTSDDYAVAAITSADDSETQPAHPINCLLVVSQRRSRVTREARARVGEIQRRPVIADERVKEKRMEGRRLCLLLLPAVTVHTTN